MQVLEVTTPALEKDFLRVNPLLYKGDPHYIRPLDKDIISVFDPERNKAFKTGTISRWVLKDEQGRLIGRIAAFVNEKYKNKGDTFTPGGIGFFDCIHHQGAANLLFDTAKAWLQAKGAGAMDGPINFGERDRWWGLLVEGFRQPLYGMNYNHAYYQELFENYGFRVFYYQNCWSRQVQGALEDRFFEGHRKISTRGGFSARMVEKEKLDAYAIDFVKVYNSAWATHEGNKEMTEETAKKMFRSMKPVMDEHIAWFVYYKDEPVGFYINIPDLNQAFRHFNGRFGWLEKLRFLLFQKTGRFTKMVGIIFGIVPRFHGLGVDYFLIVEAANHIQGKTHYTETELQWQGDFNPKINNISKHLGFEQSRKLATYRYIFDRSVQFERHPLL